MLFERVKSKAFTGAVTQCKKIQKGDLEVVRSHLLLHNELKAGALPAVGLANVAGAGVSAGWEVAAAGWAHQELDSCRASPSCPRCLETPSVGPRNSCPVLCPSQQETVRVRWGTERGSWVAWGPWVQVLEAETEERSG